MPDFTILSYWSCKSNRFWEKEIQGTSGVYRLRWDNCSHKYIKHYEYAYSCTCAGYTYRGHCKHLDPESQHFQQLGRCGWNSLDSPQDVVEKNGEYFCPSCGGPVEGASMAV